MTRPTIICFAPSNGKDAPKIFIRTLLYSTSELGQYVQNMYIKATRGSEVFYFNIWGYGDNGTVRGSGLFLNKSGVVVYHHFLLQENTIGFEFNKGTYLIEVYAETVKNKVIKLFADQLILSEKQKEQAPTFFDWIPNEQRYASHF